MLCLKWHLIRSVRAHTIELAWLSLNGGWGPNDLIVEMVILQY